VKEPLNPYVLLGMFSSTNGVFLSLNLATTFSVSANGMIFGDTSYFDTYVGKTL